MIESHTLVSPYMGDRFSDAESRLDALNEDDVTFELEELGGDIPVPVKIARRWREYVSMYGKQTLVGLAAFLLVITNTGNVQTEQVVSADAELPPSLTFNRIVDTDTYQVKHNAIIPGLPDLVVTETVPYALNMQTIILTPDIAKLYIEPGLFVYEDSVGNGNEQIEYHTARRDILTGIDLRTGKVVTIEFTELAIKNQDGKLSWAMDALFPDGQLQLPSYLDHPLGYSIIFNQDIRHGFVAAHRFLPPISVALIPLSKDEYPGGIITYGQ